MVRSSIYSAAHVRAKFLDQCFTEVRLQAMDDHRRAFGDATASDRFADTGAAAGDHDRLCSEVATYAQTGCRTDLTTSPRCIFSNASMPVGDRPDPADDRLDVQLSTGQQRNDAFPNGPVVAEAALQRHVLLNQRIEVETKRLRTPTDFGNPTRRSNQVDRNLERDADSRRIDDAVAAETIPLQPPRTGIADDRLATVCSGNFQPMPVRRKTHQGHFGSANPCHRGAENPNRSRAKHDDSVSRFDPRILDDRVVRPRNRARSGRPVQTATYREPRGESETEPGRTGSSLR